MKDPFCNDDSNTLGIFPLMANVILKPEPIMGLKTQISSPSLKTNKIDSLNLEIGNFKENPITQIKNNLEKQYEFDKNWILNVIEEKELYSQDIINEVFDITEQILNNFYSSFLKLPLIPKFLPGPKGTIDVFWKSDSSQFIFNYNPLNKQNIEYFGKDKDGNETRGMVHNPKRLTELLGWSQNLK